MSLTTIDFSRFQLKPGDRILDLGCAPGSWLQFAAQTAGTGGRLVGIDLTPVTIRLPDNVTVITGDVADLEGHLAKLGQTRFDVVLSDMAPATTGNRHVDEARSVDRLQAGQRLIVGFEGTHFNSDLAFLIDTLKVGGIILFSQNIVDPDQLRQVFLNILLNAIQAMPDGGTLSVKTTTTGNGNGTGTTIIAQSAPTQIAISISDSGEGIAHDRLEKIFEPFATFKDDGTGLGLSIVTQILKLHHATITVDSQPGQGSTFTIVFPCQEGLSHAT